jgi:hypothetical protein
VTEGEHIELCGLAERAIAAATKLVVYLDAAGPDWKKEYLAKKREEFRARRDQRRRQRRGTTDPCGNVGPETRTELEHSPTRQLEPENLNENLEPPNRER